MEQYLKTYSDRTIRSIFWSGNNYALPEKPAADGANIAYWYGADEKKDRKNNIRFLTRHPEEFCRYAEEFLTERTEGEEHK